MDKAEAHVQIVQMRSVNPLFIPATPERRARVVAHHILDQTAEIRIPFRWLGRKLLVSFIQEHDG